MLDREQGFWVKISFLFRNKKNESTFRTLLLQDFRWNFTMRNPPWYVTHDQYLSSYNRFLPYRPLWVTSFEDDDDDDDDDDDESNE